MNSPITVVRLIALLLTLLLVSVPSFATDEENRAQNKHPKPGETETVSIVTPRPPTPPDPTPSGTGPNPSEANTSVGCWLLRSALIVDSPTALAAALLVLGAATVEEASAMCS